MASITLYRLDSDLAFALARILRHDGHRVHTTDFLVHADTQIVFAGGDGPDYCEVVRRLVEEHPGIPIVVVNRVPENSRWLDALELGASDYCGAPFEPMQVRWLVDAVMRAAA